MTTAPALPPTAPLLGEWQPLPTAGAATPPPAPHTEPATAKPSPKPFLIRLANAGHWTRDTLLGVTGFLLVLGVALAGWTASFIGLHDFGMHHMGLSHGAAWLVPLTFDGAPAGLSLVVFRASINGRTASTWRLLIVVFTALSAWINYQHIDDATGRWIACFMPPSAVVLFEGLMSEARHAAETRSGRQRPRVHPLRWIVDRKGTWKVYRAYILGIELPDHLRTATDDTTPDHTDQTDRTEHAADRGPRTADRAQDNGPQDTARTATDHTTRTGPDQRTAQEDRTDGPDQSTRTVPADRADRTATPSPTVQDTRSARTAAATERTADRTDDDLILTDLEAKAIQRLRSADRSISKRSIQDVIRNDLNGSIASDRAVQIARHYRTLRSAA